MSHNPCGYMGAELSCQERLGLIRPHNAIRKHQGFHILGRPTWSSPNLVSLTPPNAICQGRVRWCCRLQFRREAGTDQNFNRATPSDFHPQTPPMHVVTLSYCHVLTFHSIIIDRCGSATYVLHLNRQSIGSSS